MLHLKLKVNRRIHDIFKLRFESEFEFHKIKTIDFTPEQKEVWKRPHLKSGFFHDEFFISWLLYSGSRIYLTNTIDGKYELEYFGDPQDFKWYIDELKNCEILIGPRNWFELMPKLN